MKIIQRFYKEAKTSQDARQIVSAITGILELPENEFFVESCHECKRFHAEHLRSGLHIDVRRYDTPPFKSFNLVEVKLQYLLEDKDKIPTNLSEILNLMEKEN
ncbi:MAG: hypothetical protein ACLFTR_05790 [Candidatus Woesearchaeota archaeon]